MTKTLNLLSTELGNGVVGRKADNKRNIIRFLSKAEEPITIPEIAIQIGVSIPIATKLIKELVGEDLISVEGKKISENGRRPKSYSLNRNRFYVVGVEILSKFIHVSVVGTDFETVCESIDRNFVLDYSEACLQYIGDFIKKTIKKSKVKKANIFGVGIGMTSFGNFKNSGGIAYFSEADTTLDEYLTSLLELPIHLNSDTRTISIAEQSLGLAKGVDNAIVVKVSRRLGLGIIIDKQVVQGQNGLSGNFNHMQFGNGSRPCSCGKIGCLGTIVGGNALLKDLEEALMAGEQSYYFKKESLSSYKYHEVLDAILKGDELSIRFLQQQGNLLGQALGNIVNLLDPELVIIGGEFTMVKDFFIDAINMGMKKTALVSTVSKYSVKPSTLGRYLGSKAGACMVLKAGEMIDY